MGDKSYKTSTTTITDGKYGWKDTFEIQRKYEDALQVNFYDEEIETKQLLGIGTLSLESICVLSGSTFSGGVKLMDKDKEIGQLYFEIEFTPCTTTAMDQPADVISKPNVGDIHEAPPADYKPGIRPIKQTSAINPIPTVTPAYSNN